MFLQYILMLSWLSKPIRVHSSGLAKLGKGVRVGRWDGHALLAISYCCTLCKRYNNCSGPSSMLSLSSTSSSSLLRLWHELQTNGKKRRNKKKELQQKQVQRNNKSSVYEYKAAIHSIAGVCKHTLTPFSLFTHTHTCDVVMQWSQGLKAGAGVDQANVFCSIRQRQWQQHHLIQHHHSELHHQESDCCCCHCVCTCMCMCVYVWVPQSCNYFLRNRFTNTITSGQHQSDQHMHTERLPRQMILQVGPSWKEQ